MEARLDHLIRLVGITKGLNPLPEPGTGSHAAIGKKFDNLRTPCCLISLPQVLSNCDSMIAHAASFGMQLRPMTKTHKTIEGACFQLWGSFLPSRFEESAPLVVSTLPEANFYFQEGFRNILYPYTATNDKLLYALAMLKVGALHFCTDSLASVDLFEAFANSYAEDIQLPINLYIDIDPDYHRSGVLPLTQDALDIAHAITKSKNLRLAGLYAHGGQAYLEKDRSGLKKISQIEQSSVSSFAKKLKDAGIHVSILSVGSTPTASSRGQNTPTDTAKDWPYVEGVNELHPGNYIFYDAHQAMIGSCDIDHIAITVLARVVGVYASPPRLLIDAAAFALSKDRGPEHLGYHAYALVKNHPELHLTKISQEIGIVEALPGHSLEVARFPLGTLLELIPNHSCMTSYCYENLFITNGQDTVIDVWRTCPRHGE